MRCDFEQLTDGTWQCRRCGFYVPFSVATAPVFNSCGTQPQNPTSTAPSDLPQRILDFLRAEGPATSERVLRFLNCERVPGILSGMATTGELQIDTPTITDKTLFSLPSIDAVYPLGTGSRWSDSEIRFSLRSLQKNFPELGRVFIVGEKPDWLTNVIHIPLPDSYRGNKDANLIAKVLAACKAGISPRFIRLSDDEFFLRPTTYAEMPPLFTLDLTRQPDSYFSTTWNRHLRNTRDRLQECNLPALHYDTHCPNAYHRDKFVKIMGQHPWQTTPYTINTLYYNAAGNKGRPAGSEHVALQQPIRDEAELRKKLAGPRFANITDGAITPALQNVLLDLFPEPSRFENETISRITKMPAITNYSIPHERNSPMQDATTMKIWSWWKGPKPGYVELCQETLRHHCPEAQILDEPGFREIQKYDRDVDYSHLCLAHQADWIRLNLLYTYGGIWLDADCIVLRPLQRFVDALRCCWFLTHREPSKRGGNGGIGGGFIGAPPQSYYITEIYNRATEIVRSKRKPAWKGLMGHLIEDTIRLHFAEGFFCVDWHQIHPLPWPAIKHGFWQPGSDEEHARTFNDGVFAYMMIHKSTPAEHKQIDRDTLLRGNCFASYLFRKSLGLPAPTEKEPPQQSTPEQNGRTDQQDAGPEQTADVPQKAA